MAAVTLSLLILTPALASNKPEKSENFGRDVKELRAETRSKIHDLKEDFKESKKEMHRPFIKREVTIRGELTGVVSTTALTVKVAQVSPGYNSKWAIMASTTTSTYPSKDSVVTVKVESKTKLYRRYFGKTVLPEMAVGDRIKITGWLNVDGTITATYVKDDDIEFNSRLYRGAVQSLDSVAKTLTILPATSSSTITVKTDATTKFVKTNVTTTTFADIKVGDTVGTRGTINTRLNVMMANVVRIYP